MRDAMRSRAAWIMSMLSIDSFGVSWWFLCLFVAKTEFKHLGEVGDKAILDGAQRRFVAEQFFHRSHGLTFAGDDQVEITEVRVDVECKAVRRDPARDVNSDRGDFTAPGVYARQTLDAKRLDTKIRQRPDQNFFQIADVTMEVFAIRAEVDNRIPNDLPETVIRDFPAAIRLEQRHVALLQFFLVEQNRRAIAATPYRERMRMFEQQQRVGLGAGFDGLFGLFLERE